MTRAITMVLLSAATMLAFVVTGCDDGGTCEETECEADCESAGFAGSECVGNACQCQSDGDADGDADGDGDGDADADADTDADGPTGFDVLVEVLPRGASTPTPAPSAPVAFVAPGGVRLEDETDAEGRVRFDETDFDWAAGGTGTLTAYVEGYAMQSVAGLTEEEVAARIDLDTGALPLVLQVPIETFDLVEVKGVAYHMDAPDHVLDVFASAHGSISKFASYGDNWSVQVPRSTPFTIVLREYSFFYNPEPTNFECEVYHWAMFESDGLLAPSTFYVDLDTPVEVVSSEVTLELPEWMLEGADVDLRVTAYTLESDLDTFPPQENLEGMDALIHGASTYDRISYSERTAVFGFEHIVLDGDVTPMTRYLWNGTNGAIQSWVVVRGYPGDGVEVPAGLEPPDITNPRRVTIEPGDEINWVIGDAILADPSIIQRVIVYDESGRSVVHIIEVQPGLDSVVLPAAPSEIGDAAILGDVGRARVLFCEPDESIPGGCSRWANSELLMVEP